MQLCQSSQRVTGLVVNKKVNVPAVYWRTTRSMCNRLFYKGDPYKVGAVLNAAGEVELKSGVASRASIVGRLNHIYSVEMQHLKSTDVPASSKHTLYSDFLFYNHFFNPVAINLLLEGKTDSIY